MLNFDKEPVRINELGYVVADGCYPDHNWQRSGRLNKKSAQHLLGVDAVIVNKDFRVYYHDGLKLFAVYNHDGFYHIIVTMAEDIIKTFEETVSSERLKQMEDTVNNLT